jgi:hypothetical protein
MSKKDLPPVPPAGRTDKGPGAAEPEHDSDLKSDAAEPRHRNIDKQGRHGKYRGQYEKPGLSAGSLTPCRPARKPRRPTALMAAPAAASRMRPNPQLPHAPVRHRESPPTRATAAFPAAVANATATTPITRPKKRKGKRP